MSKHYHRNIIYCQLKNDIRLKLQLLYCYDIVVIEMGQISASAEHPQKNDIRDHTM